MAVPEKIELPFLRISYQKDLCVLFCRWQSPVKLKQFIQGYMATLQLAAQHGACFWLHDLRSRNMCSVKQKQWFVYNLAGDVQNTFPHTLFLAFLVSPLQYECFKAEPKPGQEAVSFNSCLRIRYYTYEHDAVEWLKTCRLQQAV